jgi:hypothetical protein
LSASERSGRFCSGPGPDFFTGVDVDHAYHFARVYGLMLFATRAYSQVDVGMPIKMAIPIKHSEALLRIPDGKRTYAERASI